MHQPPLRSARRAFLSGAIVLAPLAVTLWVFNWLIGLIGGPGKKLFSLVLPEGIFRGAEWLWTLLAAIIALLLVTLLGYLSRYVAAKFLLFQTERVMQRVPFIGVVYNTSKQLIATFSADRRAVFEKVVLIPFPHAGTYALGFLTYRTHSEMEAAVGTDLWHVFVPTTPNPTSGFMIMVPRQNVIELSMTIGEGMKLIISGGAVVPPWPPTATPVVLRETPA